MDAKLRVLRGPLSGRSFRIPRGEVIIGREENCQLRAAAESISRHHCMLIHNGDKLRIRDLGSKNGTFVNRRPIGVFEVVLSTGDNITIGDMVCEIELTLSTKSVAQRARIAGPSRRATAAGEDKRLDRQDRVLANSPRSLSPAESIATGPASWRNALNSMAAPKPILVQPIRRLAGPRISAQPSRLSRDNADHLRSSSWHRSLSGNIALKPVSEHRNRAQLRDAEEEEDAPGPYRLAKNPFDRERQRSGINFVGILKKFYRGGFGKLGRVLRWTNETAYGISILFLMLACVGFAMQVYSNLDRPASDSSPAAGVDPMQADMQVPPQRDDAEASHPKIEGVQRPHALTILGVTGIVVLNLVRLVAGAANLIVIPFRRSPLHGALFLIPPLTFLYVWRHWNQLQKPVSRMISPLFALALVVIAYTFLPFLSPASRSEGGLRSRLKNSVHVLKDDVTRQVDKTHRDAKSLKRSIERDLPGQLDKAQKTANELRGDVEKAIEDYRAPSKGEPDTAKPPNPDASNEGR